MWHRYVVPNLVPSDYFSQSFYVSYYCRGLQDAGVIKKYQVSKIDIETNRFDVELDLLDETKRDRIDSTFRSVFMATEDPIYVRS